ncbi:hypothetical protein ACX80N_12360 [Arthrobacter sp. MDT2-16]
MIHMKRRYKLRIGGTTEVGAVVYAMEDLEEWHDTREEAKRAAERFLSGRQRWFEEGLDPERRWKSRRTEGYGAEIHEVAPLEVIVSVGSMS